MSESNDEPTNEDRAARILAILPVYAEERGDTYEPENPDELRDLIADALHYAKSKGWDAARLLADAALTFAEEDENAPFILVTGGTPDGFENEEEACHE